jgi:integrase
MGKSMRSYPSDTWVAEYLYLLGLKGAKYVMLYHFGVETGLRISDVLKLRVRDIRPHMRVYQTKTKSVKEIKLSDALWCRILSYVQSENLHRTDFFIHRRRYEKHLPLSRVQAYRVLSSAAKMMDTAAIGPHSMRKQYAKNIFKDTGSFTAVQKALGHRHLFTTMHYFFDADKMHEMALASVK